MDSKFFFGTNEIAGLQIFGPKKILGIEKNFELKKMLGQNFFEKNCGSKKILI